MKLSFEGARTPFVASFYSAWFFTAGHTMAQVPQLTDIHFFSSTPHCMTGPCLRYTGFLPSVTTSDNACASEEIKHMTLRYPRVQCHE